MLRGYAKLQKNGQLDRIMDVQIALVESSFSIQLSQISKNLFGAALDRANEATRDFLISRVALYSLNKSLLQSLGKKNGRVVHPLPRQWRNILISLDWDVDFLKSKIHWIGFLACCMGYGIFLLTKNLFFGLVLLFFPRQKPSGKHIYFADLSKNELPQRNPEDSFEIISWYLQWSGKSKDLDVIGHGVKSFPASKYQGVELRFMEPVAPPQSISSILQLLCWGFRAVILCLFDFVRGRWWSPLMLGPCVESFLFRIQSTKAANYLFHCSRRGRPLWTYEAEKKGAIITYYFYSTNSDSFMTRNGYQKTPAYYRNMQWNQCLVWDEEQVEFLVRSGFPREKIQIVGPIWFSDSPDPVPNIPKNNLCYFDVQPRRKAIYVYLGEPTNYYTSKNNLMAFNIILRISQQKNKTVVWKEKRDLISKRNNTIEKNYSSYIKNIISCKKIIHVSPNISAHRLIKICDIIISMPFTSTAIIAKKYGKKSCYFDPIGALQKNDRAAHNIPIISGENDLQKWLEN